MIFADVKALYDLRSNLVHGAIITQRELQKWLGAVSAVSGPEDRHTAMRIEQLVDRLRDLVRRSILMRLLLNSEGRWPLRGDPQATRPGAHPVCQQQPVDRPRRGVPHGGMG